MFDFGKSVIGSNIHDIEMWIFLLTLDRFVKLHDVSTSHLEALVTWFYSRELLRKQHQEQQRTDWHTEGSWCAVGPKVGILRCIRPVHKRASRSGTDHHSRETAAEMSVRRRTSDRALGSLPQHNVFWAQQQVLPPDSRSRHGVPTIPHSVQSLHGEFREDSVVICTKSPLDVAQICGRYVCEDTWVWCGWFHCTH